MVGPNLGSRFRAPNVRFKSGFENWAKFWDARAHEGHKGDKRRDTRDATDTRDARGTRDVPCVCVSLVLLNPLCPLCAHDNLLSWVVTGPCVRDGGGVHSSRFRVAALDLSFRFIDDQGCSLAAIEGGYEYGGGSATNILPTPDSRALVSAKVTQSQPCKHESTMHNTSKTPENLGSECFTKLIGLLDRDKSTITYD